MNFVQMVLRSKPLTTAGVKCFILYVYMRFQYYLIYMVMLHMCMGIQFNKSLTPNIYGVNSLSLTRTLQQSAKLYSRLAFTY